MSVIAPKFRVGYFLKSVIDIILWIVLIFTLIGLPIIFLILFFVPLPVVDGELVNPFLALTWLADPSRTLPMIKALMLTDIFRIAAFPGFGFAALIAAATIFAERKMLAKLQLRVGPFYCENIGNPGTVMVIGPALIPSSSNCSSIGGKIIGPDHPPKKSTTNKAANAYSLRYDPS